jgi:hypothetical protein
VSVDRSDQANMVKVEFEASAYTAPDGGASTVSFDFSLADIAFF